MLEKTFSTFYASNIILQQQYGQRNFTKYLKLILVLLAVEKTNELLKNHDLWPIGSTTVFETHANANTNKNFGHFRGRGRKQGKDFRRGDGRSGLYNRNNPRNQNRDNGQKPTRKQHDICNRCGLSGHWSRTCRTQKHFVDLYQASLVMETNLNLMIMLLKRQMHRQTRHW